MNKMADSLYYSTRDFRDIILAELAKLEYGLREHSVNAAAVAQVRSASAPSSASAPVAAPTHDSSKELAEARARIEELEAAASAASISHQAELKKLRKENVELQSLAKQSKQVDELEAQLEEAQRQIRTLNQENIALRNTLDMNEKYAAQDKKAYADLLERYGNLEYAYSESLDAKLKASPESAPAPNPAPVEQKKEVKKAAKPVPESAPAPSPEPEEEEVEEEAEGEEEEGEEPVEFEYKGKTYYLSSDNDVYQDQEGEFVQVGTWNGKKILFQ